MIGEPQRAFYDAQFGNNVPLLVHYGVPLWVPEAGGAVDPGNEANDLIASVFGGMTRGERNRLKKPLSLSVRGVRGWRTAGSTGGRGVPSW
ncbi:MULTISPECIES: hypothetical protein [unclassified Streptomyces]|uniref:hypothetical protein n=1 Tax=unclassified Streptomyces TaxID=2593676 RepID=UPI002366C6FD|nr:MULTISPECIES: hypothetical protein [unclassified Streptomyces]MDF3143513.1 hypothetical protein [Streptomyces sp. T21Q-yed]WDF41966.1 hypothetical protein PBV52_36795 [Streptomyces sp. T12]